MTNHSSEAIEIDFEADSPKPALDGWSVAREIAGWLNGQDYQLALRQIERLEERAKVESEK